MSSKLYEAIINCAKMHGLSEAQLFELIKNGALPALFDQRVHLNGHDIYHAARVDVEQYIFAINYALSLRDLLDATKCDIELQYSFGCHSTVTIPEHEQTGFAQLRAKLQKFDNGISRAGMDQMVQDMGMRYASAYEALAFAAAFPKAHLLYGKGFPIIPIGTELTRVYTRPESKKVKAYLALVAADISTSSYEKNYIRRINTIEHEDLFRSQDGTTFPSINYYTFLLVSEIQ
jgi:hypothetical protein